MRGVFHQQGQIPFCFGRCQPFGDPAFQFALAVFDRTVVTGSVTGAVYGDDHQLFQDVVNGPMVQIAAVIPFDKQRRAVAGHVTGQMTCHLLTAGHMRRCHGSKLVAAAQILQVLNITRCVSQPIKGPG